jgi:hypothetical protein
MAANSSGGVFYRDDENNAGKISDKLPEDIKKLFSDFPPKKK